MVGKTLTGLLGFPGGVGTGALLDFLQLLNMLADRPQTAVNLSIQLFEADIDLVREGRIFHLDLFIFYNGFVFGALADCNAKIVPCAQNFIFYL